METLRAFIAIELPEDLKHRLSRLQEELSASGLSSLRWVKPDSIHLTLKFLGDVPGHRIEEIGQVMRQSVAEIPEFRLDVSKLGVFPSAFRVRVVWVGLGGDLDLLKRVQESLESGLETGGFSRESREFSPHLTLARVPDQASAAERRKFGEIIANRSFEGGVIQVRSINLIRSQLTRNGAIYTRLASAPLVD